MEKQGKFIQQSQIRDCKTVDQIPYFLISKIDEQNPFFVNTYNYENFYRGRFSFSDPATEIIIEGTPEEYGRRRITACLVSRDNNENRMDLGAGSLNILRELTELKTRHSSNFYSADISGPWNDNLESQRSTLEYGISMLPNKTIVAKENGIINVQYDMNSDVWPFISKCFDTVVSCMALHHIKPENKRNILSGIFDSLKDNGSLILMDFFLKNQSPNKVTETGEKGPVECSGYGQNIIEFLNLANDIGYKLDLNSFSLLKNRRDFLTEEEYKLAIKNLDMTIQINKASWFINLKK